MKNRGLRVICALLCAAIAACSATDGFGITPLTLNGTWVRVERIPGMGEQWDLTLDGKTVTGTGTWTGEACCAGTLTVNGSVSGDSLHLVISRVATQGANVPPSSYSFDGVMASDALIVGAGDTPDAPNEFRRAR